MTRTKLNLDEIEDQRELMGKLQWLLSALSEAGVLPTGNAKVKPIIVIDKNPPEAAKNPSPKIPSTNNISRGLDFADSEQPPALSKSLGLPEPGLGLNSFIAQAVLPQAKPRPRPPKEDLNTPTCRPETREDQPEEKEYFFEAYYIIPRSMPRNQPHGQIQLTKPLPDDYMIICLDVKEDRRKDPNLRNALRRAKRARSSVTTSSVDEFPKSVREAAISLASHRKKHANGMTWSLVDGVKLRCSEESMFRKTSSKSGFLIVFRGSDSPDKIRREYWQPPSILKGSVKNRGIRSMSYGGAGYALGEFPREIWNDAVIEEDMREGRLQTSAIGHRSPSEPKQVETEPTSGGTSPEDTKKKAKVEFENAEPLKSERPISRPLPGPVLYDPARSKLVSTPLDVRSSHSQLGYGQRTYWTAPGSWMPTGATGATYSPSGSIQSASQIPQSPPRYSTYPSRVAAPTFSYESYDSYAMPSSLPPLGWDAALPSISAGAPIIVSHRDSGPPKASMTQDSPTSPEIAVGGPRGAGPSRRKPERSTKLSGWESGSKGKAKQCESGSRGRERIVLEQRRTTAVVAPRESESEGSDSEGRRSKVRKATINEVEEVIIEGNSPEARRERRRRQRECRIESTDYGSDNPTNHGLAPDRRPRYAGRLETDPRKFGMASEAIASRLQNQSDSRDDNIGYESGNEASLMGTKRTSANDAVKVVEEQSLERKPLHKFFGERTAESRRDNHMLGLSEANDWEKRRIRRRSAAMRAALGAEPMPQIHNSHRRGRAITLSDASASAGITAFRKSESEEILDQRLKQGLGEQDEEIKRRPAVPLTSGSYGKTRSLRPVVTYFDDDWKAERDRERRRQEWEGREWQLEKEMERQEIRREREELYDSTPTERPRRRCSSRGIPEPRALSAEDSGSESAISDFSSASGDEDSTLVEEKKDEGEELHLTQSEAQAMMMNFLATFTAV